MFWNYSNEITFLHYFCQTFTERCAPPWPCGVCVPQSRVVGADIWTLWCTSAESGPRRPPRAYHSPADSPACAPLISPGRCSSVELWWGGDRNSHHSSAVFRPEDTKKTLFFFRYEPSGLSGNPSQPTEPQLLLMLEVREAQAWRGMVPITNGNDRDRFNPPGMSTYTCGWGAWH